MACYPCTWQVPMLSLLAHILLLASSSVSIYHVNDDLSVLLSFKYYIKNDPGQALSSWDATDNGTNNLSTDFCRWNGIACNDRRHPGRVTAIRLRGSDLGGTISPHIGNLTQLQHIDLSQNNLLGEIPVSLGSCTELRTMNLSVNQLSGSLFPDPLGHLSKLKVFNVRHNNLTGVIPITLSNLTALTNLSVESNNLQGQIPSWLCNLTSLAAIDLAHNGLDGHIPSELGKLTKVATLMIQGNQLEGPVPASIFNISSIQHLDLRFNQLSGSLPLDIGFQLPNILFFATSGNQFEGLIPASFSNASALESFLIRRNQYHGLIPRDIGIQCNLKLFSVGYNQFQTSQPREWDFLTSLNNCSKLQLLDLEQNNFVGIMPVTIANLSKELTWLTIARNQIAGTIAELGMFQKLIMLTLGDNLFTGTLPVDIGRLRSLQILDLSHNRFEGQIPQSLGNITGLSKLSISNNYLNGTIPTSLGKLRALASMDISCNFLSGRIPQEILSIPALTILLKLSNNALSGSIPTQIGHLNNLIAIDLSMNKLTGEIPDDIGSCVQLQLLHLQGNILQGKLPKGLEKLGVLENLDLSRNNLIGPIPEFLERIKTLNHLNLSFNNLSGPVPDTGIFCNATILSLTGNSMLCGGPPFLQFPSCASVHSQHRMHLLIVFCIPGTLIFLLFSITTYCCIKRRVKPNIVYQENLFLSEAHERISYNQLRSATQSFSPANLIGSGSFGNVYIGTFIIDENLATVAIKVINLNLRGASRSFLTECNALRRIRHRNLVKVITVCSGLDHNGDEFKALVLEFICNGSLDEWLHPNTMENSMTAKRLSLMRRLCIALDVAVALEYLHHNIEPPIVHSDIKPSNILLDDDLVAHVTDFGLAKIMYAEVWNKNHGGNEKYGSGYGVSTDGDIYSYGVLLLEMLTGKRPTDSFDHGTSLVSYVKMAYPNKLLEILDVSATYSGNTQDVIDLVIHPMFGIALACCQDSPRQRIKMDYVVEELKAIKKACAALMGS
ncbi:hypothetical protein SETIT_4G177200v2 [Setaria italica]|uniref:Receptor kinase-like protein Xa21 n=1 Tax=Setaria italica TaxID=4555 RepID=A0A368QVC6_SETIT|nr:hypothetical protein SETIT_4G177200v2 [Setaria italica]